ncbi:MAG TPA: class I SAM-dependent methyltransferase [Flavobacteriales bacterium]|jgi:SAM-dependent methyltransferase|nr:class I SAM-dependent methyltransferase [Flavobacteriales bacterium]MBK7619540.1 class I SAM-dependent methyltransferase [Flavobacteriales bacterium]MBK8709857.1 class I SAM-dependent methyltransferase [Flavobacteriales bacterium]MBP9178076.1 class I SAM-dependent methyltransferase [Flavobacteriales bacterium]MCC6910792.1 class I SAM-dependent methyltransferase [Flavobacteriales bacterium]
MQYDPVKRRLGVVFNRTPFLRILFYRLLDLLLLRAWHIQRELRQWMSDKRGRPLAIYDAGAGFGQYSYWLSGKLPKASITAIDVKDEQVADCNAFFQRIGRQKVKFKVGDVTKYTNPEAFELIVCVDVMEHILEDEAALRCYSTSLKAGGMLIISTPSDQGGSDVHEEGEGSFIEEHVRDGYNLDDIRAKCLRNGFSKVEARYSYGAPGKISWKLSMKWPLLMLQASKLFLIVLPFYYLIAYPIAFVLNMADVRVKHATGTGLIVKAWK